MSSESHSSVIYRKQCLIFSLTANPAPKNLTPVPGPPRSPSCPVLRPPLSVENWRVNTLTENGLRKLTAENERRMRKRNGRRSVIDWKRPVGQRNVCGTRCFTEVRSCTKEKFWFGFRKIADLSRIRFEGHVFQLFRHPAGKLSQHLKEYFSKPYSTLSP